MDDTRLPRPFTLHVPDDAIADLRDRLARTRFPDATPGEPWTHGTDLPWLQKLVATWQHAFDWRAAEAQLNAFPQFKVALQGIDLHYLHVPGKGPRPVPLLLSHGWPGSVFEFVELIPRLTDPARFGGDPADAFTVIAPSLPGYGLSFTPGQPRLSPEQTADLFAALMVDVLGHRRFAAHGGDWGSFITGYLGYAHAEKLIGIHLTLLTPFVPPSRPALPSDEERRYADEAAHWQRERRGYTVIQGTRPQTLAYGLTDSPAGLAAWIAEKFQDWCDGDIDQAFTSDQLLRNIALYWFTGTIGTSFWYYYTRYHGGPLIPPGAKIAVPAGHAVFPGEILRPPRSLVEPVFTDLQRWTVMERGGHFAALEQPAALAEELRAFFRPLRAL
jgi:microsomal epoxide hydrolase